MSCRVEREVLPCLAVEIYWGPGGTANLSRSVREKENCPESPRALELLVVTVTLSHPTVPIVPGHRNYFPRIHTGNGSQRWKRQTGVETEAPYPLYLAF